jgi:hypothetical protein
MIHSTSKVVAGEQYTSTDAPSSGTVLPLCEDKDFYSDGLIDDQHTVMRIEIEAPRAA